MKEASEAALREADRCVKCGLCLPGCPTYRLYADESESPRGRIALAEALLKGEIGVDHKLQRHLGNCLLCRQCEVSCPSLVDYGQILDAARQRLPGARWTSRILGQTHWLPMLGKLARYLPGTPGALSRSLGEPTAGPPPGRYRSGGPAAGRVGLLLGCVTRFNQGSLLSTAVTLLTRLGYEVSIPPGQTCCGALAAHSGDQARANRLQQANNRAFAGLDAVVGIASGCSHHLHSYPDSFAGQDISEFLDKIEDWTAVSFLTSAARCVVHHPCTLCNGLGAEQAVERLLARVPGWRPIAQLGESGGCCGAAGDHLLRNRTQATALRQPLIEQMLELAPEVLITSNVGCAMHLAEGLRRQLPNLRVLHPVEWLVEHLESPPAGSDTLAATSEETT